MRSRRTNNSGFTLLEMVLAISLFSLILVIGYQAITMTAKSRLRISTAIDQQESLRVTFRSLSHAFRSIAPLQGKLDRIEFDLSRANSTWLQGARKIQFIVNADGELWAFLDDDEQGSLLMSSMAGAEFTFIDGDVRLPTWDSARRPRAIELSWFKGNELQQWRFGDL